MRNHFARVDGIPRLLIIEDNEFFIDFYKRAFSADKNLAIEVAINGLQALEKISSFAPHFVILDLQLPFYSGFKLMKILDSDKAGKPDHVFVLTGVSLFDIPIPCTSKISFLTKQRLTMQRLQLLVNDQVRLYNARHRLARKPALPNVYS